MALWDQTIPAFGQERIAQRARRLGLSQLACLGRHTITGLLCTAGRQDRDWSADCRFFSQYCWQAERLFAPVLDGLLALLPPDAPLVTGTDDTCLKKTGTHIPGVAYRRDPLSPPFHTNFIRAHRCLQISGMLPAAPPIGPARAIPLAYRHVPPLPKPKPSAPAEAWKTYRRQCRQHNLSTAAVAALRQVRADLDARPHGACRRLLTGVDGSYTNGTVLRGLPRQLREELWGHALKAMDTHSDHFASTVADDTKCPELHASLPSAVLYADTS